MAKLEAVVHVRLTKAEKAKLEAAAAAATVKPSEFGRRAFLAYLASGEASESTQELTLLRREVSRLHRDLGNSIVKLLERAGTMDRDEAIAWARRQLTIPSAARPPGDAGDEE